MSNLKTQVMTMLMMKSSQNKSSGEKDIFIMLYSMCMMNIIEWVFKMLPHGATALQTLFTAYFTPQQKKWIPLLDNTKQSEKDAMNSVSMTRLFSTKSEKLDRSDNILVEKIDAVLDYLCSLDNAKHVKMDTRYSLNSMDDIELAPLLKARIKDSGTDEDHRIEIVIYSTALKVSEIRRWIDEIHNNYVFEKNNKLGNRIYYFNEIPADPIIQAEIGEKGQPVKKSYRWDNMPKILMFTMDEFKTSKSFTNVYGNHVEELKERLDLFINRPDWYTERGIPHSLGILLHGVPGAGKTSTIKAIAKDTHRHIVNISLRPYTSQRQLTNLFFNETLGVHSHDGTKQMFKIPLNRRVYVIEDIDCLTDVVLDRSLTESKDTKNTKEGDAVTLSFLLNLLDGVLETPGRILVMTSNYPEKLDRALVRPGRIDVSIEFKHTSCAFILDMMNRFYTIEYTLADIPKELESVFTPAEVMESMCRYFKTPDAALVHMVDKISTKKTIEEQYNRMIKHCKSATEPTDPNSGSSVTHSVSSDSLTDDGDKPEDFVGLVKQRSEPNVTTDAHATTDTYCKMINTPDGYTNDNQRWGNANFEGSFGS